MKMIYLSEDDLNHSLVAAWCFRNRIEVDDRLEAVSQGPTGVLVDADHASEASVRRVLDRMSAGGARLAVVAHGYGPLAEALAERGVAVYPRLRGCVLSALVAAARASRGEAARSTSEALTWVNLG
ncbi:MAG: hypothetical protein U0835_27525 [Isosphaeraceae bacterium]